MIVISMSLDWGPNENTEKLPITRKICYALIYGAGSVYKTYTTGQLRIKTVFQNNNIQDSFHAFLFIFLFFEFLSRVQSSIRGG